LKKLNPDLNNSRTPRYYAGTFKLRVPRSSYAYQFKAEEPVVAARSTAAIKTKKEVANPTSRKEINRRTANSTPRFHKVKRGETLISVSRKYGVTPRAIA